MAWSFVHQRVITRDEEILELKMTEPRLKIIVLSQRIILVIKEVRCEEATVDDGRLLDDCDVLNFVEHPDRMNVTCSAPVKIVVADIKEDR